MKETLSKYIYIKVPKNNKIIPPEKKYPYLMEYFNQNNIIIQIF